MFTILVGKKSFEVMASNYVKEKKTRKCVPKITTMKTRKNKIHDGYFKVNNIDNVYKD